jgi:transcriptional regulator with XRE-family HTH domain
VELDQLATRSGVSKGMLVQIEQARTNPSIGTLCRLADAFGVTLAQLVELAAGVDACGWWIPSEVVRLWEGADGSGGDLLVGTDRNEHVELWRWHLAAGDQHDSEGHLPAPGSCSPCSPGTLTLEVGRRRSTRSRPAAPCCSTPTGPTATATPQAHARPRDGGGAAARWWSPERRRTRADGVPLVRHSFGSVGLVAPGLR